jgi:hypothetical protein
MWIKTSKDIATLIQQMHSKDLCIYSARHDRDGTFGRPQNNVEWMFKGSIYPFLQTIHYLDKLESEYYLYVVEPDKDEN